jgi:16S rRNA (cytidine1402-2'-O)-methyltransferase
LTASGTPFGTLYVVATPIGNLEDITLRAVTTLRSVDRVYAEDTRRTRGLLAHLAIEGKPLVSLEAHASAGQIERAVEALLRGESAALVTDAGVPAVSDPGAVLVQAAARAGVCVVPIPGASAVTAAVAASGIVTGGFRFFGFLPRGGTARSDALTQVASTPEAVVLFESPQRMSETLRELAEIAPARAAVIAREMTKVHEEFLRGSLAELAGTARDWLGEISIVLAPDEAAGQPRTIEDAELDARIDSELATGTPVKAVAQRVAAWSGRPRREVYERALRRKEQK